MYDQAAQLRRLMMRNGALPTPVSGNPRRLLMVVGGRLGSGATTTALHLSLALVQQGQRTVLVDADDCLGEIHTSCGLPGMTHLGQALSGECTIHEVVQRGPGGLQVVVGANMPGRRERSPASAARLAPLLRALEAHADWVVVDAGRGEGIAEPLWAEASAILCVTTPDAMTIMETYSSLKTHLTEEVTATPSVFINFAHAEGQAADVHRRLDESCRRFLGRGLAYGGWGPSDTLLREATETGNPMLAAASPFADRCEEAAGRLSQTVRETAPRHVA